MINDDALVELAGYCARTCHVLKEVTQGRGTDGLSCPSEEAIEDLRRYVDSAHPSVGDDKRHQNHAQHRVHSQRTPEQRLQFAGVSLRFHPRVSNRVEDGASDDTKNPQRT